MKLLGVGGLGPVWKELEKGGEYDQNTLDKIMY